jgi:transposase
LRAKAHQGLVVIDTPEYRSSKMCSRCKETVHKDPSRARVQIRHIDDEIQVRLPVPVWGIRRCYSDICGGLRWNRDHNAAINIRDNLLQYLASGTWPQRVAGISTTITTTTSVDMECNCITHNV